MEQNTNEPTEFQQILQRLGTGNTVVRDTIALLAERGLKVSRSAMYQALDGRSNRRELIEAFLETAEAEFERRRQVRERAARLIHNA
ncbi:hypothetical protein HNQ93_001706 [Hymenobacter luteus]|uniref:Uncharacterized protein n=2 Tax=Hymenobacter TaxID=89966 RepID=A0A7W9T0S2_9BACT|nr:MULTISPECIES: hypothetical protein [Hymenobacter]MBB4600933.1 hypothetical protein [Hymenobacter latericoloratus]MBB6058860.1 hypothetical protein [Hymenobacter luteus]